MADTYYDRLRTTAKCPICGKRFIPAPEHAWQIGNWDLGTRTINVCSYTCMRKWEKERIAKDKKTQQV